MIMKLDQNVKQVTFYTHFKIWVTKGLRPRSRSTFDFGTPFLCLERAKLRDFKLSMQIGLRRASHDHAKVGQSGHGLGQGTYSYIFGPSL